MKKKIILGVLGLLIILIPYALWEDVRLLAIDTETGRLVWSQSLPNDKEWTSRPQVQGLRVFVWAGPRDQQQLFAFNSIDGKPLWHHQPKGGSSELQFYDRPLNFAGDLGVYRARNPGEFVALDLDTGKERWRIAAKNSWHYILSNPTLDKVIIVEIASDREDNSTATLKAYTLSGKLLWSVPTTAYRPEFSDSIAGDDRAIYIGLRSIYKLNSKTGDVIFKTEINAESGFNLDDGLLYGAYGSRLSVADASTGKILWHYDEPNLGGLLQSPVVGDKIYLTNSSSRAKDKVTGKFLSSEWLLAISREGKEIWHKPMSSSNSDSLAAFAQTPAIISGGVVAIGEDALLAFDDRGNERWRFPLKARSKSAASKDNLVYVTAVAPRYKHWLAYINPLWH
jgi:outer membrane protein assembly factor BamB